MISSPVTAARRYHLFELGSYHFWWHWQCQANRSEFKGGWKLSPPKQTTKKKKSCKSGISNACRQPVLQKEQPQKGFRPHEHKSLWASENQMYEGRLISLWQSVKWESNARQLYKKLLILKIREIKDFYLFSQNERKRIHGSEKKKIIKRYERQV